MKLRRPRLTWRETLDELAHPALPAWMVLFGWGSWAVLAVTAVVMWIVDAS